MRRLLTTLHVLSLGILMLGSSTQARAEDWKGTPAHPMVRLSALTGLGVLDSRIGLPLAFMASGRVIEHGFIGDLNDSVSAEALIGPLWVEGRTAWNWGARLRWDFEKDANWTIYALGGVGGHITPSSLGSRFTFLPHFGIGLFYRIHSLFDVRAEVSHDLIAAGVSFPFY